MCTFTHDENIILPNEALYSISSFRNNLNNNEIFLVMDCCEGGLNLPFVLNEKIYRLENENSFVKPEMICIASSLNNEKSITSKTGSFFTRHLFNILFDSNINIYEILKQINDKLKRIKQTANVSVSHPKNHHIFGWFYKPININIVYHPYFIEVVL